MENYGDNGFEAPLCKCGLGKMVLKIAGLKSNHPGRKFYKCPRYQNHPRSFIWYDEHHGTENNGSKPDYGKKYYTDTLPTTSSITSTGQKATNIDGETTGTQMRGDLQGQIALAFVNVVFLLIGIVIGRLL